MNQTNERRFGLGVLNTLGNGFGILFIFCGVFDMTANFLQGLIFTLMGVVLFSKTWRFIEKKTKIKNGWMVRIIVFILLVVLFGTIGGK